MAVGDCLLSWPECRLLRLRGFLLPKTKDVMEHQQTKVLRYFGLFLSFNVVILLENSWFLFNHREHSQGDQGRES